MPTLAKSIEIRDGRIYVDGAEFPWFVDGDDSVTSTGGWDRVTTVNLTIPTESFSTDSPGISATDDD